MSWLAAARKRVFEMLASSAVLLASASSEFSRVSSSVRSRTRFSSVALARSSASAASNDRRDVGEGDDESAAGHPVGAHLDHHVPVGQALQIRLAFGGVGGKPPLSSAFAVVGAGRS